MVLVLEYQPVMKAFIVNIMDFIGAYSNYSLPSTKAIFIKK